MSKKFTFVLALLLGQLTYAQDSSSLDPVVFTATKSPVKLSETGKMITIISAEQIQQSQGKNLSQILTEQSGIVVNGAYSNSGKDKTIFLRGAAGKYTLILLDGVPINDPSGVGGVFDVRLFPVEIIDRIEILKGSQSTLYGSDAVAGVINIITKKGGTKPVGFSGGLNYGSYNTLNADAGLNGRYKFFNYHITGTYAGSDGISEAKDKDGSGVFDRDGYHRKGFQGNFSFDVSNKLKISPYYRYQYYDGDFDADAFTDAPNTYQVLVNNAGANAVYELPKGTITANYGYTYTHRHSDFTWGEATFKGRFHTGDLYLTQRLADNVKLLAGVNFQRYGLLDTTLAEKDPTTSIVSPYASVFLQSPQGLQVEIGSRYNHHSKFGSNFTYSFNAAYAVNQQWKFFANVSTGFRAPTVTDLFGAFGANPSLKPEKSENVEAGVQLTTGDKKWQVRGSGFYRRITDLITFLNGQLINIDEQRDRGAEAEVFYAPDDRWRIRLGYQYVTGKLTQTRDGKDSSFYNLIRRPKHSVNTSIGFQATPRLYMSVALQTSGDRTDLFFDPNPPYGSVPVTLKKYTVLNAYAEYKLWVSRLRFFVDARNLTDTDFDEVYGYNVMGINASAGFRIKL